MINSIAKAIQEILYPRYCLLCREKISSDDFDPVCAGCMETIPLNSPPFCQKCGRKISGSYTTRSVCKDCFRNDFYFDRGWACCSYQGALKELIHYFKYKNRLSLERQLSEFMVNFIKGYRLPVNYCDYIIPVPLSKNRLREREFNQAQILARNVARYCGLNLLDNNLCRRRDTVSQAKLNKDARWQNMLDAFALKVPEMIKGKIILLVDDVLTTGATASESAKALKKSGASAVFVLTLAN